MLINIPVIVIVKICVLLSCRALNYARIKVSFAEKQTENRKQVVVILELIKRMQLYNKGRVFICFVTCTN